MNLLHKRALRIPLISIGVVMTIIALLIMIEFGINYFLVPTDKFGRGPRGVVAAYEKSKKEKDGITLQQVAQPQLAEMIADVYDFSLDQKAKKKVPSPGFVMNEYKIDSFEFYYHVKWQYLSGTSSEEGYRVIYDRDKNEWKLEEIDRNKFEVLTNGLTSEVIRRNVHDQDVD
ncbi:hypothetical protein SAMN05444392_11659 [Seinonella peptonophila]|uniref:Uncharacterized protein n=1 Tax=Seinonella peptonophila TaxID=112248 RepID=A0A1M5AYE6_9BACL|nr:hypothetical protein [Seinonella peptonophila]SHF34932.1 hypothetical protein SAMN05444392_11659 [Seinonella peptonophila]